MRLSEAEDRMAVASNCKMVKHWNREIEDDELSIYSCTTYRGLRFEAATATTSSNIISAVSMLPCLYA